MAVLARLSLIADEMRATENAEKATERIRPYLERANFLTIRYEDLVCKPEGTAQRMYDFLGCDFSTRYLQYDRQVDPHPDRWNWVPEAGGRIDPSHASKGKDAAGACAADHPRAWWHRLGVQHHPPEGLQQVR